MEELQNPPATNPEEKLSADKILKYASLVSVFLVLSGVMFNVLFYESFGIHILDYTDFTESLLMFVPTLNIIIIFCITLYMTVLFYDFIRKFFEKWFPIKNAQIILDWMYRIVLIAISILIIGFELSFIKGKFYLIYIIVCFIPLFIYRDFANEMKLGLIQKKERKHLLNVALLFFPLIIFFSDYISNNLKANGNRRLVTFTFKNANKISSDSTNLYLGQCKNFFFFYDLKTKTSTAYSKADVSQISIKDLP